MFCAISAEKVGDLDLGFRFQIRVRQGGIDRRVAIIIWCVYVGPSCDQQLGHFLVAYEDSPVQRGAPMLVPSRDVYVGPVVQEQFGDLFMSDQDRQMQGVAPETRDGVPNENSVDIGARIQAQLHGPDISLGRGL